MDGKIETTKSIWNWIFGRRSVWDLFFRNNFADKNTAALIVAILLFSAVCYVVVWKDKYEYLPQLLNLVFVVVGYYFGQKGAMDSLSVVV